MREGQRAALGFHEAARQRQAEAGAAVGAAARRVHAIKPFAEVRQRLVRHAGRAVVQVQADDAAVGLRATIALPLAGGAA